MWDPPAVGDAVSYEVRIVPHDESFRDIGLGTTFTPDTDISEGAHHFYVRAVGPGERKDSIVSLGFFIDTLLPSTPAGLHLVVFSDELEVTLEWQRATDPGFSAPDNPLNTGSGVDSYNVTVDQQPVGTTDDSLCVDGLCRYHHTRRYVWEAHLWGERSGCGG